MYHVRNCQALGEYYRNTIQVDVLLNRVSFAAPFILKINVFLFFIIALWVNFFSKKVVLFGNRLLLFKNNNFIKVLSSGQ
jgi:hypothetical protein